ncbi:hypothetical protein QAD02_005991 [Eretmocerus hayati]|uniref:Uncharacterized protein n=1 Tax=Eretmocerus hayati TaxID=131215 RepID=A0ACC2MZU1_9HYME|nr:hypothetical protein QAD02_005991 [Eretmocerus hayati]
MFNTLQTFDTEYSADSVEWCPTKEFKDIFVCGTYQLTPDDEKNQGSPKDVEKRKRVGIIYLFRVIDEEEPKLDLLQKLNVAAVLDMKWAHVKSHNNRTLLGVVNSEGFLQIYELVKEEEEILLKLVSEILVNPNGDNSVLALSLDWSTGNRNQSDSVAFKITVSDSLGTISLFAIHGNENKIERINSWQAHEFEAWITSFDYWDTNVVFTGGDDGKFLQFDTRLNPLEPVNVNKSHGAGVTSLHSNWKKQFCLVSGSYDENLRVWDTRKLRRPISELNVGGGIWRLKWDPYKAEHLLAACMYNGFCIVDCANLEEPKTVSEYKEHESIAYGCDWSYQRAKNDASEEECPVLVGTCSFYDHVLKLSSLNIKGLRTT